MRGGAAVHLTPKAHDLLVTLVRHAGRLVTKEALLAEVWPDAFVEEGILAVHVSTLRKALGDASRPPAYIETVARSGYRFIAPVTTAQRGQPSSHASRPLEAYELVGKGRACLLAASYFELPEAVAAFQAAIDLESVVLCRARGPRADALRAGATARGAASAGVRGREGVRAARARAGFEFRGRAGRARCRAVLERMGLDRRRAQPPARARDQSASHRGAAALRQLDGSDRPARPRPPVQAAGPGQSPVLAARDRAARHRVLASTAVRRCDRVGAAGAGDRSAAPRGPGVSRRGRT